MLGNAEFKGSSVCIGDIDLTKNCYTHTILGDIDLTKNRYTHTILDMER